MKRECEGCHREVDTDSSIICEKMGNPIRKMSLHYIIRMTKMAEL